MEAHEHEAPPRIEPTKLADYLDILSKTVFQTGMSWRVIEAKWPGTREALNDFDPETIARLTPDDVDRLAADTRLIRNRRKIEATIHNAQTMLALDREYGGFRNYLRSHPDFDSLLADMRKRFKFVGDMGAYFFLWVVSEPVPEYDEFSRTHSVGRR
jgi:3-methyladenine DNA glycosylase Tag